MRRGLIGAVLLAALVSCAVAVSSGRARAAGGPGQVAQVTGRFLTVGTITAVDDIPGEYLSQKVKRFWTITPADCVADTCRQLSVLRSRAAGAASLRTTLELTGPGQYRGSGFFWVALKCMGKVWPHGSRAPYTLTLTVTQSAPINGVQYATQISATYTNPGRTDRTRCPLGPTYDSASYAGRVISGLPAATTTTPAPTTSTAAPSTPAPAPTTPLAPAPVSPPAT